MKKDTIKLLVAFVLGQAVQIVCHSVCINFWERWQIPFCAAAGFLIALAVFAGAWISRPATKPEHIKSYRDWAEVPGADDTDFEVLP